MKYGLSKKFRLRHSQHIQTQKVPFKCSHKNFTNKLIETISRYVSFGRTFWAKFTIPTYKLKQ